MYLKVISSLLFLIPAFMSAMERLYLYAGLILICTAASVAYHLNREKNYGKLDMISSVSLMLANSYVLFLSGFSWKFVLPVLLLVLLSFYFWSRAHHVRYTINHSLWHAVSVGITICCILSYTSSQL